MPTEREFSLPGLTLAAREWGEPGQAPVIAVHGWLDNAGSFDLLAPLLEGCHVIALDSAGHGHSGNRSPDASYDLWQEVGDLLGVADAMGWSKFSMLGHSRGAAIAALTAGTCPDRVASLVLIEGGIPVLSSAEDAPENLAQALKERGERKSGRVFADRATALEERANGFSKVALSTAEILARRSLRQVEGGFRWHVDPRLKGTSAFRLSAEHMKAFVSRIDVPVLILLAEQSPFANAPAYREMLEWFDGAEIAVLPGAHHFHLEGAEAEIAARTLRFLSPARLGTGS